MQIIQNVSALLVKLVDLLLFVDVVAAVVVVVTVVSELIFLSVYNIDTQEKSK